MHVQLCLGAAVPPCAIASCSTSALLEDEWGAVQAVASLSLRLLDLGHSVLPHLITAPLQQVRDTNFAMDLRPLSLSRTDSNRQLAARSPFCSLGP
jgi:hypothetical protein